MKKLSIIFLLLFSVMFSSNSFSEWIKITRTESGSSTWYYDSNRVFKKNGFVNYWELTDYASEDGYGYLSDVSRVILDCELMRFKDLQIVKYKGSMGTGKTMGEEKVKNKWVYPLPNSVKETATSTLCRLFSK